MNTRDNKPNWLFQAIFEVISPIVRLLIGTLNYPQFCEILKLAYVREAKRIIESKNGNTRVTKSELSLLTGIDSRQFPTESHLIDTSEKFSLLESSGQTEINLYPETEILGLWHNLSEYLSPEFQKEKIIPISGKQHSFESFVRRFYTRGVTIQSVLNRLVSYGNVELVNQDYVKLQSQTYIPMQEDKEELLKIGLVDLHYLAETISNNVSPFQDTAKFFQRHVKMVRVKQTDFSHIRQKLATQLNGMLQNCEALIVDTETGQEHSGPNFCGVGFYYFEYVE